MTDLQAEGFTKNVAWSVEALTRNGCLYGPALSYLDWVRAIAGRGSLAPILVKIADLEDNADPARLALLPPEKAASLAKRFDAALPILREAFKALEWRA